MTGEPRLTGIHYRTQQPVEISIEDGIITKIEPLSGQQTQDLPLIAPGLTDLQVNGYRGIDFNKPGLSDADIEALVRALWAQGVTSFCPTIITNDHERMRSALGTVHKACGRSEIVGQAVAGIHLEGPFISLDEGPVGAHPVEYVVAPDEVLLQSFLDAAGGQVKILTLSPEWAGAGDFIRKCIKNGLVVSIGHTAATPEQIQEAVRAGATMSTHLGNATHQMLPRHPNYIWEQLAQDKLTASVIADGFHLPDSVLKIIFRVKKQKVMLVSDSTVLAGMPPGSYESPVGGKVVLTGEGKLHIAGKPKVLAGSAQSLLWGVQHLVRQQIVPLAQAWDMASLYPNRLMKLPQKAGLQAGAPADLVRFRYKETSLQLLETYKAGQCVWQTNRAGITAG
ncbi:N-acetylglucosamine-6-phosphate deacetylase [Nibrella saemangeumensis]|uniref:N-acetylglucosamine-6-phosphate deacetylase n=1 Tax=Nibrella saemangeumensis TaxID=1084526 RepID=A0ABP8MRC8_9BACT